MSKREVLMKAAKGEMSPSPVALPESSKVVKPSKIKSAPQPQCSSWKVKMIVMVAVLVALYMLSRNKKKVCGILSKIPGVNKLFKSSDAPEKSSLPEPVSAKSMDILDLHPEMPTPSLHYPPQANHMPQGMRSTTQEILEPKASMSSYPTKPLPYDSQGAPQYQGDPPFPPARGKQPPRTEKPATVSPLPSHLLTDPYFTPLQ